MQTARVYEYQGDYGYDYQEAASPRRVRNKRKSTISTKDKNRTVVLTLIVVFVTMLFLGASVLCANLQYEIEQLTVSNANLEREIEDMSIALDVNNSLPVLEQKAKKELGMKYPDETQIVYVDTATASKNFEATVRQQAYN